MQRDPANRPVRLRALTRSVRRLAAAPARPSRARCSRLPLRRRACCEGPHPARTLTWRARGSARHAGGSIRPGQPAALSNFSSSSSTAVRSSPVNSPPPHKPERRRVGTDHGAWKRAGSTGVAATKRRINARVDHAARGRLSRAHVPPIVVEGLDEVAAEHNGVVNLGRRARRSCGHRRRSRARHPSWPATPTVRNAVTAGSSNIRKACRLAAAQPALPGRSGRRAGPCQDRPDHLRPSGARRAGRSAGSNPGRPRRSAVVADADVRVTGR